jgi:CubicO group peptidase (beta-lactamase class C family)
LNYPAKTAVFPDADWQTASAGDCGLDSVKLEKAIRYLEQEAGRDGVKELFIVRDGYAIWQGDNVDKIHGVWSLTKSFTSTILGLLVDAQKCEITDLAQQFLPELAQYYPQVNLRHFATMTSGYRAIGDEPRGSYRHGPSQTPFLPSPQPLFPPGEAFAYWDSAMNEFAHVLTIIAGVSLDSLFYRKIAEPIGMQKSGWRWQALKAPDGLRVNGGAGNLGKGMYINAKTLARFGYLFLNQGNWNGNQLVSKKWISQATSVQVPDDLPLRGFVDHGPGTYGLNWWINGVHPSGEQNWPGAPAKMYAASGYNNNDMFVIPEWRMVIVRLGLDQEDVTLTNQVYGRFIKMVSEAILDALN